MKLSRALKEKNRLIKRITAMRNNITSSNVVLDANEFSYDMADLQANYVALVDILIELKVAIQIANQPILAKIYALSELKAAIAMYSQLDTKEGAHESGGYGNSELRQYKTQISRSELDIKIEELQSEIDAWQDEIDEFNSTTKIDFELPDLLYGKLKEELKEDPCPPSFRRTK